MSRPVVSPRSHPDGGWRCNVVVGCDETAEILWQHVVTDGDLDQLRALPWPGVINAGDAVAVWACHAHVPESERHVCEQAGGGS